MSGAFDLPAWATNEMRDKLVQAHLKSVGAFDLPRVSHPGWTFDDLFKKVNESDEIALDTEFCGDARNRAYTIRKVGPRYRTEVVIISVADHLGGVAVDTPEWDADQWSIFGEALHARGPKGWKTFVHNLSCDAASLFNHGVDLLRSKAFCTLQASRVVYPHFSKHGIDDLAVSLLKSPGKTLDYGKLMFKTVAKQVKGKRSSFNLSLQKADVPDYVWYNLLLYAARDAELGFDVGKRLERDAPRMTNTAGLPVKLWQDNYASFPGIYPLIKSSTRAVVRMEARGIPVNIDYIRDKLKEGADKTADALRDWHSLAPGVNPGSAKQLAKFLFGNQGIPISPIMSKGETPKGKTPTDGTAIEWMKTASPAHVELLDKLLYYRKVSKSTDFFRQLESFALHRDGWYWIHSVAGMLSDDNADGAGAVSGRLTMKTPNVSALPKVGEKDLLGVRGAFEAPEGWVFVGEDWSGLETVIQGEVIAWLTDGKDRQMLEASRPGAPNLHCSNVIDIFGRRLGQSLKDGTRLIDIPPNEIKKRAPKAYNDIKSVWFALAYGKGAKGFGVSLRDERGNAIGEGRAQAILDALLDTWPGLRLYQEWTRRNTINTHRTTSLFGRQRVFEDNFRRRSEGQVNAAVRAALNHPMQSTGADLAAIVMARLMNNARLREMGSETIWLVHDQIVMLAKEEHAQETSAILKSIMSDKYLIYGELYTDGGISKFYKDV